MIKIEKISKFRQHRIWQRIEDYVREFHDINSFDSSSHIYDFAHHNLYQKVELFSQEFRRNFSEIND